MLKCYENDYQITPYKITPKRSSFEAYALLKRTPYVCDLTSQPLLTRSGRCSYICRGVSIDTRNSVYHTVVNPIKCIQPPNRRWTLPHTTSLRMRSEPPPRRADASRLHASQVRECSRRVQRSTEGQFWESLDFDVFRRRERFFGGYSKPRGGGGFPSRVFSRITRKSFAFEETNSNSKFFVQKRTFEKSSKDGTRSKLLEGWQK